MILLKTIKFYIKYLIGELPMILYKNNNLLNKKIIENNQIIQQKIFHLYIFSVQENQDWFSGFVRTSSLQSFPVLNDENQSYAWSINNHVSILEEAAWLKPITKEDYIKYSHDFSLNIYWNGYLPVHDNKFVIFKNFDQKINSIQKKENYVFNKKLIESNISLKISNYLKFHPYKQNNLNNYIKLLKSLPEDQMINILKNHDVKVSDETLITLDKLNNKFNYNSIKIDMLPNFKQEIIEELNIKKNLSLIFTDLNVKDL